MVLARGARAAGSAGRKWGPWAVASALLIVGVAPAHGEITAAGRARVTVRATMPSKLSHGRVLRVRGRAAGAFRHTRLALELQRGTRWVVLAKAKPSHTGSFRLAWRSSRHPQVLVLRVAALAGRRSLGASKPRRVWLKAPVRSLAPKRVLSVPEPGQAGELRYHGHVRVARHSIVAVGIGPASPYGFLGEVISTARAGANTVVRTAPTTLIAAVPNGDIHAAVASARGRSASTLNQALAEHVGCSAGGSVSLAGSVFVKPSVRFDAHWSLFHGVSASFTGSVTAGGDLKADADASAECSLSKTSILAHPWVLSPIEVQVGPIPVVLVPEINVFVSADGKVGAAAESDLHASITASAGLDYSHGKFSPTSSLTHDFGFDPPSLSASGHLGGKLSPTLDLLLYGLTGPEATFDAGLSLDADTTKNPWWTLTAPVDLKASLDVPLLGLGSGSITLAQHTFTLAHASGPINPPPPPPPSQLRHINDYEATPDLACTLTTSEDSSDEFYANGTGNDACGTFVAIDGNIYGPSNIPAGDSVTGVGNYVAWDPLDQQFGGSGTSADPYTVTTTVAADGTDLVLTETDRWVDGGPSVSTSYAVTGQPGDTDPLILYRAADCYVGDSDVGNGAFDASTQTPGCLRDLDGGGQVTERLVPVAPAGAVSVEDFFDNVWADIGAGGMLPGTCDCSDAIDDGEATSWSLALNGSAAVTAASRFEFAAP